MRSPGRLLLLAAALFVPVAWARGADVAKPRNIILFGWDGAQRNHVHECLERGERPTVRVDTNRSSATPSSRTTRFVG